MSSTEPQFGEVIGELIAYRVAVLTLLGSHPSADQLHAQMRVARESGASIILGGPHSDETFDGFQRAMDAIIALLPTQSNT